MKPQYCDLSIPLFYGEMRSQETLKERVLRAFFLGYSTVAIDLWLTQEQWLKRDANFIKKSKAKRARQEEMDVEGFPQPPEVKLTEAEFQRLSLTLGTKPRILYRLTLCFEDNSFLPSFQRSQEAVNRRYDLLAVCPPSAEALTSLVKSGLIADVVAVDAQKCLDVKWTRQLYKECLNSGMHLELPYGPLIRDAGLRQNIIAVSHAYQRVGQSKAVIFSSQAESALELRGPHDVANLTYILGMNEHQGKLAVHQLPQATLAAAKGRKMGPFRVQMKTVNLSEEEEIVASKKPRLEESL